MPAPDIVAAYRHRVFGLAMRLLGDREDAADVTQDVLVRLWQRGGAVPPEQQTAWVLTVTRNACLDVLRKRQTRETYTPPAHDAAEATSMTHGPDVLAEASDFRARIERALAGLSEPYRSIVLLREVEDHTYEDIATAVGLPLNTVKVYLHRGRQRLRDALRHRLPAEDLDLV